MIDDKLKVIGIDIPRTASSARARLFAGMPENEFPAGAVQARYWNDIHKHATALEHLEYSPEKFSDYFKFTFVRNPWDRMVSFFRYRSRKFGASEFRRYIIENKWKDLNTQQIDYLVDKKGRVLVDFIGRFENLYQDFDIICQRIYFEQRLDVMPEKLTANYVSFYDDRTRQIVANRFKDDIELFGYNFIGR